MKLFSVSMGTGGGQRRVVRGGAALVEPDRYLYHDHDRADAEWERRDGRGNLSLGGRSPKTDCGRICLIDFYDRDSRHRFTGGSGPCRRRRLWPG